MPTRLTNAEEAPPRQMRRVGHPRESAFPQALAQVGEERPVRLDAQRTPIVRSAHPHRPVAAESREHRQRCQREQARPRRGRRRRALRRHCFDGDRAGRPRWLCDVGRAQCGLKTARSGRERSKVAKVDDPNPCRDVTLKPHASETLSDCSVIELASLARCPRASVCRSHIRAKRSPGHARSVRIGCVSPCEPLQVNDAGGLLANSLDEADPRRWPRSRWPGCSSRA